MRAIKWFTAPVIALVLMLVIAGSAMAAKPQAFHYEMVPGDKVSSVCGLADYDVVHGVFHDEVQEAGPNNRNSGYQYATVMNSEGVELQVEAEWYSDSNSKSGHSNISNFFRVRRVSDNVLVESTWFTQTVRKGQTVFQDFGTECN